MKFLINVFLIFFVHSSAKNLNSSAKSLNQRESLSYEELKNDRILVKNSFQRSGFSEFITVDGKVLIKKKKMSRKKFLKWVQQDKFIFISQFEPNSSPYAGPISNQVKCAKNLKPKPLFTDKNALIMEGLIYKSNSRFVALSCQNMSDFTYDSAYIVIYCTDFGYKITIHKKNKLKEINKLEFMRIANAFFCFSHKP